MARCDPGVLGHHAILRPFVASLLDLDPAAYVDQHVILDGFLSKSERDACVSVYDNAVSVLKGRVQLQLEDLGVQSVAKREAILNAVDSYDVVVPLCSYVGIPYARILQEMGVISNWSVVAAPAGLGVVAGSADQRALSEAQSTQLSGLTGVSFSEPLFFYKGKPGAPEESARAWHIDMTATVYTVTFSDRAGCTAYVPLPHFDAAVLVDLCAPPRPISPTVLRAELARLVDAVIVRVLNDDANAQWIATYSCQTEPNVVYEGLPNSYYHRSPRTASERLHVVVVVA